MPDAEIVVISDSKPEGDSKMAEESLAPEVAKGMQQAYAKAHENWLGTMQFAHDGHQVLNETGRWIFQGAASGQLFLASGILAQRSAQAQPQSPGGAGNKGVPGQVGG